MVLVTKRANRTAVRAAMSYACLQGNKTCDSIQKEKKRYRPSSNASYGFSSYWVLFKKLGGSCYFNGLATQTIKDPNKLKTAATLVFYLSLVASQC
ncbi:hypothetical protein CRG98_047264 [Punica granatum]|uniref:X8 domain-containing protein n=1 Tax=Punica granatum TaxID=22663 RepID=A0A2I0HKX4_PUNGR|nr:hypothetical protein CRG98_047264 [Punica granatum]